MHSLATIIRNTEASATQLRQYAVCRTEWARSPFKNSSVLREIPVEFKPQTASRSAGGKSGPRSSRADPRSGPKAGTRDSEVKAFLMDRVPRWDPQSQLQALGLDSLDMVQLRNSFNATFHTRLPLGLFAAPNQTLQQLADKLASAVGSSTTTGE